MLFFTSNVLAQQVIPLFGVYIDSFTGASVKVGAGYTFSSYSFVDDSSFKVYSDFEFGTQARKIGLGVGYVDGPTHYRLGLNIAEEDSQTLVGVEALYFFLSATVKLGVFYDEEEDEPVVSIGVGFGV